MDALEQYQQKLSALIAAREAAGGRITQYEEQARMTELDGDWMRLDANQREQVERIWGMQRPHKPELRRQEISAVPSPGGQPVPVAPPLVRRGFEPAAPAPATNALPNYVAQPPAMATAVPFESGQAAATAMVAPQQLTPATAMVPMPAPAPATPATLLPPRYTAEMLDAFRESQRPKIINAYFMLCAELHIVSTADPTMVSGQNIAMMCDDLDLPLVVPIVLDPHRVLCCRSFLPLEATGPFTEILYEGGQSIYVVGELQTIASLLYELRKELGKEVMKTQQQVQILGELLAELKTLSPKVPEPALSDTEPSPEPFPEPETATSDPLTPKKAKKGSEASRA